MQKSFRLKLIGLCKKAVLLLALYVLCRLIFLLIYHARFADLSVWEILKIFVVAVRFDLSVIVLLNSLFILFYLFPLDFFNKKPFLVFLKVLFIVVNSVAFLANCVDLVYFEFTLKRTTADVFHFFGGEIGNDLGNLIPVFLLDYWYIVLLWIGIVWLLIKGYARSEPTENISWKEEKILSNWLVYTGVVLVSVVLYRGGFQLKPITLVDAGEYTDSKNIPLILNTPFSVLKTIDIESIEPIVYYGNELEMKAIYDPIKKPVQGEMIKQNVFIIILESFSKEYVGALNNRAKGYTPFLDSLIGQGFVCTNAYSNGKKSIEGIPAITTSIPTWMGEAYITSAYGGNRIKGLAELLREQGYYTAFFHGGENGTMGFEAFSHVAGYTDYFGKNEYPDKKDDDGSWGIWDEPFLQFTAQTLNKKQQPFCATVFTLSSHHPFAVPSQYEHIFKGGRFPIYKTIEYTDHALRKFFETMKTMPWYANTLFVLCADHTSITDDPFYVNKVGNNAIPIIYFKPDGSLKGRNNNVTQQIDIMPSVLDQLHYPKPYFAFGKSVFDSTGCFAFSYNSGWYEYIEGDRLLTFDGERTTEMYNYMNDSLLTNNLVDTDQQTKKMMEQKVKAIIQTYQQSLILNKMVAE